MGAAAITLLVLLAGPAASEPARVEPLRFVKTATLSSPAATLGEVADLSGLPVALRARAAELTLLGLPPGRRVHILQATHLAERARGLMPALAPWTHGVAPQTLAVQVVPSPQPPTPSPTNCQRAIEALGVGDLPRRSDFEPAACGVEPIGKAFVFDRADGFARLGRGLNAGDVVADAPLGALAGLRPGQVARIQAKVGPVRVQRAVQVLKPARDGEAAFVRGSDGRVFAATAESLRP